MNCMKCGRKTEDSNVFCPECLTVMAKYPVKAPASIQLPRRENQELPKKVSRKKRRNSPEEQVARQKLKIRRMAFAIVGLAAAVCLLAGWIIQGLLTPEQENPSRIGKNYTVQTEED